MMDGGTIKRSLLLKLLDAAAPTMSGVAEVRRAFASLDAEELRLRYVRVEELRSIYTRRKARLLHRHPLSSAIDQLLTALDTYPGAYVGMVVLESGARFFSVRLTENADAVLAVMSAEGQREDRSG